MKVEDFVTDLEKSKGVCYGAPQEYKEIDVPLMAKVKIEDVEKVLRVVSLYTDKLGKMQFRWMVTAIESNEGDVKIWHQILDAVEVAIALRKERLIAGKRTIVSNRFLISTLLLTTEDYLYNLYERQPLLQYYFDLPPKEDGLNIEHLMSIRGTVLQTIKEIEDTNNTKKMKSKMFPMLYFALAPSFFSEGSELWTREKGCFIGNVKLCACIYDIWVAIGIIEKDEYLDNEDKYDRIKRFLQYKYPSNPKALIISREFFKVEK